MAILLELERRGEVRWNGLDEDTTLDPIHDCRCEGLWRAWHDAAVEHAGTEAPLPARRRFEAAAAHRYARPTDM